MSKQFLDASGLNYYNDSVVEKNANAMNLSLILSMASISGLLSKVNSPEYKYVLLDSSSHVLLGKKTDNDWYFGDETDTLVDYLVDEFGENDDIFSKIYELSTILSLIRLSGDLSEITNPEWNYVVLDSSNHVLMGIKKDYSWYLGAPLNDILDATLETYSKAGATVGTFANKPTNPNNGQMYFCTDKQTTEGNQNGIPIFYNSGVGWVDALGRTVT